MASHGRGRCRRRLWGHLRLQALWARTDFERTRTLQGEPIPARKPCPAKNFTLKRINLRICFQPTDYQRWQALSSTSFASLCSNWAFSHLGGQGSSPKSLGFRKGRHPSPWTKLPQPDVRHRGSLNPGPRKPNFQLGRFVTACDISSLSCLLPSFPWDSCEFRA